MNDKELLKQSILCTLALFAAQGQAVTLLELRRALVRVEDSQMPPRLLDLEIFLEREMGDLAASRSGLYALSAHSHTIETRARKYLATSKLFKKALRFAARLRHLPYVRAAAISGSSAQMNAGSNSDIDLFIIAAPKRIFTARFLVSAYFQSLGMRRYGTKIAGRFCLNHYVVSSARLPEDHTPYTALLYTSFLSIFGASHIRDFWRSNQPWIFEFFLEPQLPHPHAFEHAENGPSPIAQVLEALLLPVSGILETFLGWLQKARIQQSQFVVVSPQELAFHPQSRGQRILDRYRKILAALNWSDKSDKGPLVKTKLHGGPLSDLSA